MQFQEHTKMKKSVAVLFSVLSAAVFAGMNNVVVSFSSNGPDTYKDGTTVVDGECYALVWTPEGATFGGINADGTAVAPSKVALAAPLAKDGKCPLVMFQIDEDFAKANFPGGTWGVYLLDTRVFATDANGVVLKDSSGNDIVAGTDAKSVKGYGAVATVDGTQLAQVSAGATAAGIASLANVRIKDISFVGDNVFLTVVGANAGKFELSAGSTPQALAPEGVERADSVDEAVIVRPKKDGGEFFQVNRK